MESKFEEWIIQLPKILWELGANHLGSTEVSFFVLSKFVRFHHCCRQSYVSYFDYFNARVAKPRWVHILDEALSSETLCR